MEVVLTLDELRRRVGLARSRGDLIGVVPTMGALHEGHLSLIRAARRDADFVVVTLFVNPTQFAPTEDLDRYPRPFDEDCRLAGEAGADLLYAPDAADVYARDHSTWVDVDGVTEPFEGACRPGHFRGVTTVVAKLFHRVQPDLAYFGRKDYQQLAAIRKMVADLDMPIHIVPCDTVREADGLAMSSRNRYLSAEERLRATALWRALTAARVEYEQGRRSPDALRAAMTQALEQAGVDIEYAAVADAESLEPLEGADASPRPIVLLVAARVGSTRLIDNMVLGEERKPC